ncbi:MAG: hypothetical protein H7A40_00550 [Chlamydiales bacterium]|nr:hypothetical protein [Chlamydiales bacterium]
MSHLYNEIETTLDQLISNVQILHRIAFDQKFGDEVAALRKMQESLLSHLISLDAQMEELGLKDKKMNIIDAKLNYFAQLNHELVNKTYQYYSKSEES